MSLTSGGALRLRRQCDAVQVASEEYTLLLEYSAHIAHGPVPHGRRGEETNLFGIMSVIEKTAEFDDASKEEERVVIGGRMLDKSRVDERQLLRVAKGEISNPRRTLERRYLFIQSSMRG